MKAIRETEDVRYVAHILKDVETLEMEDREFKRQLLQAKLVTVTRVGSEVKLLPITKVISYPTRCFDFLFDIQKNL